MASLVPSLNMMCYGLILYLKSTDLNCRHTFSDKMLLLHARNVKCIAIVVGGGGMETGNCV